jgi:hypothetical protein
MDVYDDSEGIFNDDELWFDHRPDAAATATATNQPIYHETVEFDFSDVFNDWSPVYQQQTFRTPNLREDWQSLHTRFIDQCRHDADMLDDIPRRISPNCLLNGLYILVCRGKLDMAQQLLIAASKRRVASNLIMEAIVRGISHGMATNPATMGPMCRWINHILPIIGKSLP